MDKKEKDFKGVQGRFPVVGKNKKQKEPKKKEDDFQSVPKRGLRGFKSIEGRFPSMGRLRDK